jgi:CHRD domain
VTAEILLSTEIFIGTMKCDSIDKLIDSMKENIVYVNLHTASYPDGEIRGQVK